MSPKERIMLRSPTPACHSNRIVFLALLAVLLAGAPMLPGLATEPTPSEPPATTAAEEPSTAPAGPTETAPEEEQPTLWKILKLGGWMMYILYAISIVTIALIAFHFLSLSTSNVMPVPFVAKLRGMLEKKRFSEAGMYCSQHKSAISSIARSGLENAAKKHIFLIEAMNSEGARQASRLWQQISYLADISVIAPMCGLLGTVTGMLWTFRSLAFARGLGAGQVNPIKLADGIFQAMITTAAGLVIGIVAMAFYSVFRGMVQRLVVSLEETGDQLADLISQGD
jgi:biopolymer transport protein ExbB